MKIALVINQSVRNAEPSAEAVREMLCRLGNEVVLPPKGCMFPDYLSRDFLSDCDAIITLGGDGTIMRVAKQAGLCDRPVLGINCGHLGFLAGLELDELDRLSHLTSGDYDVENRMMLEVLLEQDGHSHRFLALNEAVVTRGPSSRSVELAVSDRGQTVVTYRADGVILATPTGSTAYSLSAGGAIVDPSMRALLLTPICPHSLYTRPYIFNEDARLSVEPVIGSQHQVFLSVDGEEAVALSPGSIVTVTKSTIFARLIRLKNQPFHDILTQKLIDWK